VRALKRLEERLDGRSNQCYFHYYGPHQEHVSEEAKEAGVTERIVLHGQVSRAEALSAVKGANLDVVITSIYDAASKEEQGIVTGKIFDAVGLGAPILLISPSGSDAEIVLTETGLGQAFRGSDVNGIASFLWERISGRTVHPGNLSEYSWPNIGKKLDLILREAIDHQFKPSAKGSVTMDRVNSV
jgi:hypothetical protein